MDIFLRSIDYNRARIMEKIADLVVQAGGKVCFSDGGVTVHSRGIKDKIRTERDRIAALDKNIAATDDEGVKTRLETLKKSAEEKEQELVKADTEIPAFTSKLMSRYTFGASSVRFVLDGTLFSLSFPDNPYFQDNYEKIRLSGNGYTGTYYTEVFGGYDDGDPDKHYLVDELWEPYADEALIEKIAATLLERLMHMPYSGKVKPAGKRSGFETPTTTDGTWKPSTSPVRRSAPNSPGPTDLPDTKENTNASHQENSFTLENCDAMDFAPEDFGTFLLADIREEISRIAVNSITKNKIAGTAAFEIFKDADTKYGLFFEDSEDTKFERLIRWRDITSITLTYENGTEETFLVEYREESEIQIGSPNVFMKTYISGPGNLYVVIDKEKDIQDFFPAEETENQKEMKRKRQIIRS